MKSSLKGTYSKLKDSTVVWDEKLSLAKNAWDSVDCVIPNKQKVLLDWTVQEIINGYKKGVLEANNNVLHGLWELLLHAIKSKDIFAESKHSVTLKPQLIQVFADIFSCTDPRHNGRSIDIIINCCYAVMSTPQLAASVLAKFESYVSFLSALLSFFVSICLEQFKELHVLVEVCLEKYLFIQRQQANQRKVFTSMCQQLLGPLVILHHAFEGAFKLSNSIMDQPGDQAENWHVKKTKDITDLVKLALTRSLFHKDHISEYPQALKVQEEKLADSDEPASKKPRISSYPKLLFEKLWEMTDPVKKVNISGAKEATLAILPLLFKEFINVSRKQHSYTSAVEFDFFSEICQMMGILNGRSSRHVTSFIFTLLHQLLECTLNYDIYQVSDDRLNGSVQFGLFKNIVEVLIQTEEPGEAVFKCLEALLKLNHSLLEPHLEMIWQMLWKTGSTTPVAQKSLMSSLISTYVQLRQFEKLVSAALVSMRAVDVSESGLTPFFNQRFSKAIQGLPFGQITSIWNIFCDEIAENCLTKISTSAEAASVKKKKKSSSQLQTLLRSLEYVSSFFSAFLLNISFGGIGEHAKKRSSMSSIGTLLLRTVRDVVDPLFETSLKVAHETEQQSACFSILVLLHALGELELFLKKFKIVEDDSETTKVLPSITWIDAISDFVPAKANKKMISILSKDRGRLCFLKSALCVQKIRSILLKTKENLDNDCEGSMLKRLVSSVCRSVSPVAVCSASWDRQEWSISPGNAPVALWDLISKHAVVLFPLCTADQQLQVARVLIQTVTDESQMAGKAQLGRITMIDISMVMIQSTGFHEMLAMQSSTVCALWERLQRAIHSKCVHGLGGRLMKVLTDISTPQFSNTGGLEEMPDYGSAMDDDADDDNSDEEGVDGRSEHDAQESSDDDDDDRNEDEEEVQEETRTSGKQCFEVKTFRTLGCELADISKSVLSTNAPIMNLTASAAECHRLLKVLGHLPLDWLSDDNHIRCLMGLFSCDVFLNSNIFQDCSPDLLKPLSLSRHLLTVMFDGCISRRRFIAHHVFNFEALHTWLIGSATKLWRQYHLDQASVNEIDFMLKETRGLLVSTFKYLLKSPPSQTAYDGQSTIQKLKDDLQTFSLDVQQSSDNSMKTIMSSYHVVSDVTAGILALCEEVVSNKTSSSKMIRMASDVAIKLGPTLLELLRAIIRASQRKQKRKKDQDVDANRLLEILSLSPVLIDCFTSVLHIYAVSEQSRKLKRVKEVYKECKFQDVFDVTLTTVIHHVFKWDQSRLQSVFNDYEVASLQSSLRFLKVVCLSCSKLDLHLPDDFHIRLLSSTLHFLRLLELNKNSVNETPKNTDSQSRMTEIVLVEQGKGSWSDDVVEQGYCLLASLFEGCEPVLLPELLDGLGDEITTKHISDTALERLRVALHIWHRLLCGRFTKDRKKELRPKLPKILFALQFVLQQLKHNEAGIVKLAIDVMVKILSLGKGMVLPHNALFVLHSSLIKLDAHDKSFPELFQSQYTLLSTLLFQHSEAVYGAVHVFITCVRNLLFSLIQCCSERNEAVEQQDITQPTGKRFKASELVQSAQKMARLYQEISSHKSTFSKYCPYMIADYIEAVQSVATPSSIRDALVPGVYCLLDLCGEHELSLLHAVLQKGSRELFHSLHADYTKYHKFKGKV